MFRVLEVTPLSGYRLRLRFSNDVQGEVNLANLAGRGVFAAWDVPGAFEKVQVGPQGDVRWGEQIDLCPDALYLQVTGQKPEDIFPTLAESVAHAGN